MNRDKVRELLESFFEIIIDRGLDKTHKPLMSYFRQFHPHILNNELIVTYNDRIKINHKTILLSTPIKDVVGILLDTLDEIQELEDSNSSNFLRMFSVSFFDEVLHKRHSGFVLSRNKLEAFEYVNKDYNPLDLIIEEINSEVTILDLVEPI